jgi:hypothetical protein
MKVLMNIPYVLREEFVLDSWLAIASRNRCSFARVSESGE